MSTEGKVVVITGASQGIGAGLVRGFLDRGYRVVANSRSIKPDASADVLAVAGDITDPAVADRAIDAEVDLGTNDGGFLLRARLNVSLPGLDREVAQGLVDAGHQLCPYSKATRGNIDVTINLV